MVRFPYYKTLVMLLALAVSASAQTRKNPGLAVGKQAPDFKLKDQAGQTISLSKLLKKGPVAIVFHRSADW